jgi:hypothetical protein
MTDDPVADAIGLALFSDEEIRAEVDRRVAALNRVLAEQRARVPKRDRRGLWITKVGPHTTVNYNDFF